MDSRTKKTIIGLVIFLIFIVLALVFRTNPFQKKELTPVEQAQENLANLKKDSKPVTTTTEERVEILKKLEKESKPVKYTEEQRLKMLESLNK